MSHVALHPKLEADIRAEFGDSIVAIGTPYDILEVTITQDIHHNLIAWAKASTDWAFNHFIDITAVDHFNRFETHRFEVVTHLRSHSHNLRMRIKTRLTNSDAPTVPTVSDVYVGASWPEREIYDLYGITFTGHPRMTRLLNPDDFIGHPLRKDFPVKGMYRGSFPKGTVISNKRREAVVSKTTKPKPADQMLPNTPWEMRRAPMRETVNGNGHADTGEEKGDA